MNNCNTESSPWQSSMDHGGKVKVVAGFAIQSRLGSGSFATVYKGNKINTPAKGEEITGIPEGTEVVAIKAISRCSDKLTKKVLENLELEISILRNYHHENIVCLYNVLSDLRILWRG
jgi:serine/threonine-protein kinase ULK2